MSLAPEAAQAEHELERKHPDSAAKDSAVPDISLHPLGGIFSALGTDGSDEANSRIASSPLLQRRASSEMRMLIMRRLQQGAGNHKTQQVVAQLHRSVIQRECTCGGTCMSCQGKDLKEEEEEPALLQRQPAQMGTAEQVVDADVIPTDSAGQPLDLQTRAFMEPRMGSEFSDVRVHTDTRAAQSADALAADAYTTGRDIYFAAGKYAPASQEGQHLIAHELTHTVQQASGTMPVAASRADGVLVGDAEDPLEAEAEQAADIAVSEKPEAPVPVLTQDSTPAVRRDVRSGAAAVWDATGGRVAKAAGRVWDEVKESAAALIDRLAPGVLPLLRSAGTFLYDKITSAMDGLFSGVSSRVQKQGIAGAITGILGEIAGSIGKSLAQLALGSCHSMVEAASSIIHFVKSIAGDAFAELGKMAKEVGDFFSDLWQDYGAPALEAIKKVAGEAWGWIKEKAEWVWDKLLPIRKAFSKAWEWVKNEFNIAKEETAGLLDWLYDKAKEQWMKIRDKIAPILGPLKIVAGALLLLSPLGPIILIWKGAPYLWKGLQWIWTHWLKPAGEWIRDEFHEHILPSILEGVDFITGKLDEASAFLCGHAGTISSALHSLEEALGSIPFFKLASGLVGSVAGFFDNLAAKGKCKFSDIVSEVKSALQRIHQFLKPAIEVLRQAVLIVEFGPWAIVDDGVWKTLNDFVALAKRTPCIREIAGLLQVDAVMEKVTHVRVVLKNIWEVISNKDKFEKEIHKALDDFLDLIPGKAEALLGAIDGLDGPHLHTLLKNYLAPKVVKFISGAPRMLIDMVWDQVWPWPGVMKDVDEIGKQVDKLKQALWDFNFSKAIDAGLGIWRGVNGVAGHLFTWFSLAAVLIGTFFGAPEAGLEVAKDVGEALLISTIAAEGLSIDKAKFNLMSRSRLAMKGKEREDADNEDFETIADSTMNVAILAVMMVLGPIAEDFAESVSGEIKGIFLPEGEEAPKVDVSTKGAEEGKVGEPAKKTEGAPEEDAAKPDEAAREIPPEELKAQVDELRQKATNPDNVHRPADPAFDAEMDAGDHTFDREKADHSWCRHSATVCDIDVGEDLNAEVDEALKDKPAEAGDNVARLESLPGMKRVAQRMRKANLSFGDLFQDEKALMDFVDRDPATAAERIGKILDAKEVHAQEVERGEGEDKFDAPGDVIEPNDPVTREQVLGETPNRSSRTGREVIDRMRSEGRISADGKQFQFRDGKWYDIADADMGHYPVDAVTWWNEVGRFHGAKSEFVRDWMLDSDNYELEPSGPNRSAGATLGAEMRGQGLSYTEAHPEPITPAEIQRQCSCGGTCSACQGKGLEEEDPTLVRRQSAQTGAPGQVVDARVVPADSPGQALDRQTREFMEPRLGSDFSDIRVHTDTRAAESADALSANAYTTGRDIYFAAGKYAPASPEGRHLLAHELTHTVQQAESKSYAPALAPKGKAVVSPADDPLEREADETADKAVDPRAADPKKPALASAMPASPPKEAGVAPTAPSVTNAEVSGTSRGKPAGAAKAKLEHPGANAAPAAGAGPGAPRAAKTVPSPAAHGKGAVSKPAVSRLAPMPPLQSPEIPAAEPPIDLADPLSVSVSPGADAETRDYNPEIAAAEVENSLAQLSAKADMRKEGVRTNAAKVKSTVAESGAAQQAAVHSRVAESLLGIRKQTTGLRAELTSEAAKVKAVAAVTIGAGQLGVLLKTATQAKAIETSAQAHKTQATAAVAAERQAVRKFGEDEGKRGKDAMEKQAQAAVSKGQSKAAGYPDDERGQAQAEAVLKVAAEVAAKLREPAPDLQSSVTDAGKDLASGIADVDKDLAKSIDEQTPKVTADLFTHATALGKQFDAIRNDVFRAVDDFLVEVNGKLDEVDRTASAELHALEVFLVAQIEASVAHLYAMLDVETESAVASIDSQVAATSQAARRIRRPHVNGVRSVIERTEAALDRLVEQFTSGLDDVAAAARGGLTEAGSKVADGIATIGANASGGLAELRKPARQSLETLGKKAKEGSDKINEEWEKSLAGVQKAVDSKYDEAIAGMVREIEKNLVVGKAKITTQVNEAVTKNREPLDQLDSKMEEAAKEARDKYDAPWYKKLGRWLLHALTSFLKALGMFLLVVLAVIVLIVVLIVGIVFDIVVLVVLAVVALIAVVVYVLYGIIKGIVDRVRSADTWWEGIWGGVVGILDIVGIPGVIEGIIHHDIVNGRKLSEEEAGDRFGSGLFAVLTFILPAKMKAGRVPVEAPRVPVEIPIERPIVPLEPPPIKPIVPVEPPKPVVPLEPPKPVPPPEAPVPKPAPPPEVPRPAPPPEAPKPAPAEPPKPVPPPEAPKPAPAEPPKPAPPPEAPKPAPAEPPKPAPPPEAPKPAPAEPPKPAPPEEAPKVPEEAPKPAEAKPAEPTSPEEIQKAKLKEAEAVEAGKRAKVKNLAELNKLKEKPPLKDKPPAGVDAGNRLWNEYVDYWNDRVKLLEDELNKNPGVEPKTRPPLDWGAYSEFRGKFIRGIEFQGKITEALQKENPNLRIEDNVGVRKPGEPSTTTKFADQLSVDESKVEGWKKGEGTPEVKTWSNKSRDFRAMPEADVNARVLEDIKEARTKYGNEVEIRRPGHPLYGKVAKVTEVTLVYDAKLVPPDIRPSILEAAQGTGVQIEFR